MKRLFAMLSVLSLAFVAGCTTSRTYDTSDALLREQIPVAVVKTMGFRGQFDTSARTYFADLNILGLYYTTLKVTWEPTSKAGRIRVTADAWSCGWPAGTLIKYYDTDEEQEFHRQLKVALDRASTQPAISHERRD